MSLIKGKAFTVYRTSPGGYVNGRWVEGTSEEFTVKGVCWPLSASEKQILSDALRSSSTYKLSTKSELYSVREAQSQSPDKVGINGALYEVQEANHYSMGVQDHYEYLVVREEVSAGGT